MMLRIFYIFEEEWAEVHQEGEGYDNDEQFTTLELGDYSRSESRNKNDWQIKRIDFQILHK